ncbi:hypothetical protein KIPB_012218, partial [Kipferlia bialata]|eukprot:g12218.t1
MRKPAKGGKKKGNRPKKPKRQEGAASDSRPKKKNDSQASKPTSKPTSKPPSKPRRSESIKIIQSFTKGDVSSYAAFAIGTGIDVHSRGPNPYFSIDESMKRRFKDLLDAGKKVALRCRESPRLLRYLMSQTVEEGLLAE